MDWDKRFLAEAVTQAEVAFQAGYAPVGVVLADRDGCWLAADHAESQPAGDGQKRVVSLDHAELRLLTRRVELLNANRPLTLYVSLEPCHMCMGAAIVARISRVVWALDDYWGGATRLYDAGREYLKLRMPELVRTPYPDLQARAARLWADHLNQYDLPGYIERMLRWQARIEE